MRYGPHRTLIAPAVGRAQLWRLALGLTLIVAIYLSISIGWVIGASLLNVPISDAQGRTPVSLILLLFGFLAVYPGVFIAVRLIHRRSFAGLFGPRRDFWRDAGRASLAGLAVYAVAIVLPGPDMPEPQPNLPFGRWLGWLIPALLAVAVQVTAEEVLFRGYLQSQLAARFRSPLVWMVLPVLLFGAMHYNPLLPGPNTFWLILVPTCFGLLAADLTARTGNLGAAVALHFLNNTAGILLVSQGEFMSGLALYRMPVELSDPELLAQLPPQFLMLFILWLSVRLILRR